MRYDDDRYLHDEDDNDLWDDELELGSDTSRTGRTAASWESYASESSYSPYDAEAGIPSDADNDPGDESKEAPVTESHDDEPDDYYSDNDYYDSDTEVKPKPSKPKVPKLDPEDPDYWISEEEESPLSGFIPKPRKKWKWKLPLILAALIALAGGWIWMFRPYVDGAVKYGYILNMERRGSIIKTFEGTMVPYKELGDPDPLYFRQLPFSVASDSTAARMKRMMLDGIPVRVEYESYHTPLPWKGEQRMIVIKADTADPRKILPPEYRCK